MRQQEFEQAISALETAVDDESLLEAKFQELFEAHPVITEALGYQKAQPHPRLLDRDEEEWIPDFLAQPVSEMGEILELKRPKVELTYGRDRRDGFRSAVHEARNQVRDYAVLFREPNQRDFALREYGIRVPAEPRSLIVIGRQRDIDPEDWHEFSRDYFASGVRIISYDEVLASLELQYNNAFGDVQSVPGATFTLIASIDEPKDERRSYVFDVAGDGSKSRWCFYVEGEQLTFEVADNHGTAHRISMTAAVDFNFGDFTWFSCEIGNSDRCFVMSVWVDGQLVDQQVKPNGISLDPIADKDYEIFGMRKVPGWLSAEGHVPKALPAAGRMTGHVLWNETLSFQARLAVKDNQFSDVEAVETEPFMQFPGPDGWSGVGADLRFAPKVIVPNTPPPAEPAYVTRFYDQTADT